MSEPVRVAELERRGWLRVEDGNHGEQRPRQNEFGSGKTRFIRAADMDSGRVLFESAELINDLALARIRKGIGAPGDILFSHKGTVGKLALVPLDAPTFVCSPQVTFWRSLDADRIDQRFLYHYLHSDEFTDQWRSRKGETDMADYVSLTAQRELTLRLPSIKAQRAIAALLGAIDDKINSNRKTNRMLEELASSLFRSWFVDFDPVVAKRDGKPPIGVPADAASLFPSHFEDAEVGPIPKGWRVAPVGEIFDLNPRRKLNPGVVAPYLEMANVPTVGHSPDTWTKREAGSGMRFTAGDTLMARITPCLESARPPSLIS
jgi:type I restriction enzyme S subunit